MGAADSKAEKEGTNTNQDRNDREGGSKKNGSSSSEISTGTALAVGAAVGTALLGVAWGVSKYRSKDSHERVEDSKTMPSVANSIERIGDLLEGFKPKPERKSTVKILSYNVWPEDCETHKRMKAIGDLVQLHSPHFICFQEITPAIYTIFKESSWWNNYSCSMSSEEASKKTEEASNKQYFCILLSKFPSVKVAGPRGKGKELCVAKTKIGTKILVVATSHLKSRTHYNQFIKQRSDQAKEAIAFLGNSPNVIFGGDMNWDEKTDGEFPFHPPDDEGWVDAWTELRGEEVGYTYDTKSNKMLKGHWPVQMRFDRILCKLKDFKLDDIEIIGKEAIPDVVCQRNDKVLPVLPSDHYGLLLTMSPS